jgi:signal transduction histidine kinase
MEPKVASVDNELRILLVEDSPDDAELIDQELRRSGIGRIVQRVDSAAALAAALAQGSWDVVLSDYFLPGFSGPDALQQLRAHSDAIPFIVVSGRIGEEEAVALMKSGADDYVMKDSLARLVPVVRRSLVDAQSRLQAHRNQLALRESEARFKAIVSNMPGMVFEVECAGDDSLSFVSVSHGCWDLFQVAPDLLLQDPGFFARCVWPDDLPSFRQSFGLACLQGGDWYWEGRIRVAPNDQVKWVSLRSRLHQREDSRICWHGIVLDITQSKLADLEVRRVHQDLARLSSHVETVKERERSHVAREIHDELGGTLTALKIMLIRLGQELAVGTAGAGKARQRLQDAEALVESTLDITRRIATSLRPAILDLGIVEAIKWQAAEFEKRMEISCQVTCAATEIVLDSGVSIALFRTFQEALTNIAKHAGATRVEVEIEADADHVTLQVHDNGRGIASEDLAKSQAYGILGMRERARGLGGEASVRRTRGGTAVLLRVPRPAQARPGNLEQT